MPRIGKPFCVIRSNAVHPNVMCRHFVFKIDPYSSTMFKSEMIVHYVDANKHDQKYKSNLSNLSNSLHFVRMPKRMISIIQLRQMLGQST